MKALVFETDSIVRDWFEGGLLARGHEVLAFDDAAAAWAACVDQKPSLLVLDWAGTAGAELVRRLRSSADGLRCVVIASGLSDRPSELQAALEAGADDYLTKLTDAGTFDARLAVAECRARQIVEWKGLDPLTGLPNRTLFEERVGRALARSRREAGAALALLFVDLDDFKLVNDTLGHLAGDRLLRGVARRLQSCLRPGDAVGRLGGDEFGVLLEPLEDLDHATRVAERIQGEIS